MSQLKRAAGRPLKRRLRLTSVALLVAPLVAVAAAAPASAAVKGYVSDLSVATDGSVRLAMVQGAYRKPLSASSAHVAPDLTTALKADRLLAASKRHSSVDVALTNAGAVTAYLSGHGKRRELRTVISEAGAPPTTQRIVSASRPLYLRGVAASPGGVAVVVYTQALAKGRFRDVAAVRAAGTAKFGKSAPITRERRAFFGGELVDIISLAFGADGTGVILQSPQEPAGSLRLRRITPDGKLSRGYTVAKGPFEMGSGDAAVTDDGTIVVAFRGSANDDFGLDLLTSSFAPAASAPTAAVKLGSGSSPNADDPDIGLAFDGAGQAVLISGDSRGPHVNVFEGSPVALKLSGKIAAAEDHDQLAVTRSGDGGVSAFWRSSLETDDVFGDIQTDIFATHRPPGGAWSTPKAITPASGPKEFEFALGDVAVDPGRGVMVALEQEIEGGDRQVKLLRAP